MLQPQIPSTTLNALQNAVSDLDLQYQGAIDAFRQTLDAVRAWSISKRIYVNRATVSFGDDDDTLILVIGGDDKWILNFVAHYREFRQLVLAHVRVLPGFSDLLTNHDQDPISLISFGESEWSVSIPLDVSSSSFPPPAYWRQLADLSDQIEIEEAQHRIAAKVAETRERLRKRLQRSKCRHEGATA